MEKRDTRTAMLDAAEIALLARGPDGIRLQDVAAAVRVSHPAVLHHFGSREGLVDAVVERASKRLEDEIVEALSLPEAWLDAQALLDRVFAALGDAKHARLLGWLLLTGNASSSRRSWSRIIDTTHALRVAAGGTYATREDTAFAVVLASLALFGEGLAGDHMFGNAGLDRPARARFRPWLGEVLLEHLARGL